MPASARARSMSAWRQAAALRRVRRPDDDHDDLGPRPAQPPRLPRRARRTPSPRPSRPTTPTTTWSPPDAERLTRRWRQRPGRGGIARGRHRCREGAACAAGTCRRSRTADVFDVLNELGLRADGHDPLDAVDRGPGAGRRSSGVAYRPWTVLTTTGTRARRAGDPTVDARLRIVGVHDVGTKPAEQANELAETPGRRRRTETERVAWVTVSWRIPQAPSSSTHGPGRGGTDYFHPRLANARSWGPSRRARLMSVVVRCTTRLPTSTSSVMAQSEPTCGCSSS